MELRQRTIANEELFGTRKTTKSKIISLLQSNRGILSDVAGVNYNKYYINKRVFLEKLGPEFIDTLVLVCPVNAKELGGHGECPELCSDYNRRIRTLFVSYGLEGVFVKVVGYSKTADYDLISKSVYAEYRKTRPTTTNWQDGYLKFKLDMGTFPMDRIFDVIGDKDMWKVAGRNFVFLKEIDATQDYFCSMKRSNVEKCLLRSGFMKNVTVAVALELGAKGIILDNGEDVGENCITWLEFRKEYMLRKKLYLKWVQMAESAAVRVDIGSNVPNIVANKSKEFQEKLVQAKDRGLTRMECTFYVNKVYSKKIYKDELSNMLSLVNKPIYYTTPFESYWKALAERIVSSMFVYSPDTKELTYCQWINSLTGKIQGMYATNVEENTMDWIRSAYSFSDRPIYYLEIKMEETRCIFIKQEIYFRDENTITLVPGINKGIYPSRQTTVSHFKGFDYMGLTKQCNIELNWPEKKKGTTSANIAKLSFGGDFEFAVRNCRYVEREVKNQATREFVEHVKAEIQEKQLRKKEQYEKLLQPLSDSKYLYAKLSRDCKLVKSEDLMVNVPYHMYGYYQNGNGHHYMLYNPADGRFYACVLSDPELEEETTTFLRLVPSDKTPVLYTCGKPFLYITPTKFRADSNRNLKAVIGIQRIETDEEIQENLRAFFEANKISKSNKTIKTLDNIKTANYKLDRDDDVLAVNEIYMVIAYGTKKWKNVERFFVIVQNTRTNEEIKIKAGKNLEALIKKQGTNQFQFKVLGPFRHSDKNQTRDISIVLIPSEEKKSSHKVTFNEDVEVRLF